MYVLDTNVVSELRKAKYGKADPDVVGWATRIPSAHMYICAITLMELEEGIQRLSHRGDTRQATMLRVWLDQIVIPGFADRVLPIDGATAVLCAKLHVPDRKNDRDALIAACAKRNGMTVVTRNEKDFAQSEVEWFNPWTASASTKAAPSV